MADENAELRRLLAQTQARLAEEERRRIAAEAKAEQSQPKNLVDFLESCHSFSRALQVVTTKSETTQGDTTKPAGRFYPQRIIPWNDFPIQQEKIWQKLAASARFTTDRVYPSTHQLDYVHKYLDPINSELGLRQYARDTVENPVRTLIQEIYDNEPLREQLQVRGTLTFESHTNLGDTKNLSIEEGVEQMSLSESQVNKAPKRDTARGSRGLTGSADQFCIYEMVNGERAPVVLIEYKPPHKLPLANIIAGLSGEIRPAEDVINKEGNDPELLSKYLLAAVITQLFSSMIGKGVQRGYVYTGEASIFLYIPDSPTTVRYYLSIPSLDFQDDDENRLHRTSVAQITAFVLSAFAATPPDQAWYDATATLPTWPVEYIDILKDIPETTRKAAPAPRHSPYKTSRWKGFSRSPIRTRARTCKDQVDDPFPRSGDEGDDNDKPPTPTPKRPGYPPAKPGSSGSGRQLRTSKEKKSDANKQDNQEAISRPRIQDRLYCTHQCLFGLASAGALDPNCPNLQDHQGRHLRLENFLVLLRTQLAKDRGRDADCAPLYVKGSRGALVKIRLSSHGYTFVGKAMEQHHRPHLLQEANVYRQLHSLQGRRIPVCLGIVDLVLPYYYDYGIYTSMLILSWAGRDLDKHLNQENQVRLLNEVSKTLKACHKHRVLHKDAAPRNWLWDGQRVMLVDFERAEIRAGNPLQILSPNRQRDREGDVKGMVDNEFAREIRSARSELLRLIR